MLRVIQGVGNQAQRSIDQLVLEKRSPLQTRGYGRFSGLALDTQYIAKQIEARGASRTSTANPEAAEPMLSCDGASRRCSGEVNASRQAAPAGRWAAQAWSVAAAGCTLLVRPLSR